MSTFQQAAELHQAGKMTDAYLAYLTLLRQDHTVAEAWNNLAVILRDERKLPAALSSARRAVALKPENVVFRMNLGDLLYKNYEYDEARIHLEFVVERDKSIALAFQHLASMAMMQGNYERGHQLIDQALKLAPGNGPLLWAKAYAYLNAGDYEKGFRAWECRLTHPKMELPRPPFTRWEGQDLSGKTLYIYGEQGLGDVIQFIRYLRFLPPNIAGVIFESPYELSRLIESNFGDVPKIRFRKHKDQEPVDADYHASLLSLPAYLPGCGGNIPSKKYLSAPASSVQLHRPKGSRLAVGICWSGRPTHEFDHERSSTLEDFFSVLSVPGVELYSLQVPRQGVSYEPSLLGPMGMVQELGSQFKDFADTAAAISQLDVVVSVDTSVAHLVGALGKSCHVLLPHHGLDWRWGLEKQDTVWYPTMRLHRRKSHERDYRPALREALDEII